MATVKVIGAKKESIDTGYAHKWATNAERIAEFSRPVTDADISTLNVFYVEEDASTWLPTGTAGAVGWERQNPTSEDKGIFYTYPTIADRDAETGYAPAQSDIDQDRLFEVVDSGDGTPATYRAIGTAGIGNYSWRRVTATVDDEIFVSESVDIQGATVNGSPVVGVHEPSGEFFWKRTATGTWDSMLKWLATIANVDLITNDITEADALPFGSKFQLYGDQNGYNGIYEKRDNTGYILINDLASQQPRPLIQYGVDVFPVVSVLGDGNIYQTRDFTYQLLAANNGTAQADNVTMTFTYDASLTFVSTSAGTETGGVVTVNVGNLAAGASATVDVVFNPANSGAISSTVATATTSTDENPNNDTFVVNSNVWIRAYQFDTTLTGALNVDNVTTEGAGFWDFGDGTTSTLEDGIHDYGGAVGTKIASFWAETSASLTEVAAGGQEIIALSGVENNTALVRVNFNGNAALVYDLTTLLAMPWVERISFNLTQAFGDLTGYAATLVNLSVLSVSDTNATGALSGLGAVTTLTSLQAARTDLVIDITGWTAMANLKTLLINSPNTASNIIGPITALNGSPLLDNLNVRETNVSGDASLLTGPAALRVFVTRLSSITYGTGLAAQGWTNMKSVIMSDQGLDTASMDRLLLDLNTIGTFLQGGTKTLSISDNAAPTGGATNPDVVGLQGKGITVNL